MSPRRRAGPRRGAAITVVLQAAALAAGSDAAFAQEPLEPEELDERAAAVVEFRFQPAPHEIWRERRTCVSRVVWQTPLGDSATTDSTAYEIEWRVEGASGEGYRVLFTYGPWHGTVDERPLSKPLPTLLEGLSFEILVGADGEALRARAEGAGAESLLAQRSHEELGFVPDLTHLEDWVAADWNERRSAFIGQAWDQGTSAFDQEEVLVPGVGSERLFVELWFEEPVEHRGRRAARVEARYFTSPADTAALEPEAFARFLEETGIPRAGGPALVDFVAAGRASWVVDPRRMLVLAGESEVRGLVIRWPANGAPQAAASGTLTVRTTRSAEILAEPRSGAR